MKLFKQKHYFDVTKPRSNTNYGDCFACNISSLIGITPEEFDMSYVHINNSSWLQLLNNFLFSLGYKLEPRNMPPVIEETINGYYLVSGETNRDITGNITHSVIYYNGKPFHDPHTSNDFLTKITGYDVILKIR